MTGIYKCEEVCPQTGLTEEQVQERIRDHQINYAVKSGTKSKRAIVHESLFTYFNLLFLILTILLVAVRAWKDMLFLVVIIANTLIGIIQKLHAKNVVDHLIEQEKHLLTAIRGGEKVELLAQELLLDDVVLFPAGSQIAADALVLEGYGLVNEALLTGEADEVPKQAGDLLLSGSFVVSGELKVTLIAVGEQSYLSRLTQKATKQMDEEASEMIRSLDNLILVIGILLIPIGIALFVQAYVYNGQSLYQSVTGMVAAVIGMIPEGLFLLASVAMAVGTIRLAKQNVLIHDMRSIETLARVDVLCVDKTGTITQENMVVHEVVILTQNQAECAMQKLIDFSKTMTVDNATMSALFAYYDARPGRKLEGKVIGFSSERKYSAVCDKENYYVLGAPERVWGTLPEAEQKIWEDYTSQGFRVLLFVRRRQLPKEPILDEMQKDSEKDELLAFVVMENPIRQGAAETFARFREQEVTVKVISGDHPMTVSAVAKRAGIAHAGDYIDVTTLQGWEDYFEAAQNYTVFGRVTPEQKRLLVMALQSKNHTVAMTGDGVNDVLALKCADCGIAMASGTKAASCVAELVLLDSDFRKLPYVASEGKRIVNNLQKTAALYIAKNIFSLLLAFWAMLLLWDYPLLPVQVTLISAFTIGIPSVILALEPNQETISGHFLSNVFLRALPAGITSFVLVAALTILYRELALDPATLSTGCMILITVVGFLLLYQVARPWRWYHILLFAGLFAGWLFCMVRMGSFFSVLPVYRPQNVLVLLLLLMAEPLLSYLTKVSNWAYSKIASFLEKGMTKLSK